MQFAVRTLATDLSITTMVVDATDALDARRQVEARGLFVSAVAPARAGGRGARGGKLSLVLFSQELLALLNAGLGIVESLEVLLEKEVKRARRYALPLAMISFDIDRFKDINDRYGHPCGDMALRTVAAAVLAVLRSTDMLVRAGGEEFQIIAPHTSAIDGLTMAEKIRATVAATPIPGCDRLTISLGVAQLADQESGDGMTVRVNAAMARAKRAGRNCVELAMS